MKAKKNKPWPSPGKSTEGLRGPVKPAAKYRTPMKGMKNANC